jgi:NAD(P)-dependent dehydrogenase (short-subunit alcohol dehydrogenase family)
MSDLAGQVGIVTGASRGIGRAIAAELAARGMRLVLVAHGRQELAQAAAELEAAGAEVMAMPADVTHFAALQVTVTHVHQTWERIDLLVCSAGRLSAVGPLWETDPAHWRADLDVNLSGLYLTCRAVVPVMVAQGSGRVVNLVGGGTHRPFPFVSSYAAAKAAVMRLTENLDLELQMTRTPVSAFAVTPGFIHTEMTEQFRTTEEGRRWMGTMAERLARGEDTDAGHAARLIAAIAAGRLDALRGRFLSAPRDEPRLEALIAEAGRIREGPERTLRIQGWEA